MILSGTNIQARDLLGTKILKPQKYNEYIMECVGFLQVHEWMVAGCKSSANLVTIYLYHNRSLTFYSLLQSLVTWMPVVIILGWGMQSLLKNNLQLSHLCSVGFFCPLRRVVSYMLTPCARVYSSLRNCSNILFLIQFVQYFTSYVYSVKLNTNMQKQLNAYIKYVQMFINTREQFSVFFFPVFSGLLLPTQTCYVQLCIHVSQSL